MEEACWSAPRVCSSVVAQLHKKGPHHRRNICVYSFWVYYYFARLFPSKNKNINYIFIYLRVFRCLSSGAMYYIFTGLRVTANFLTFLGLFSLFSQILTLLSFGFSSFILRFSNLLNPFPNFWGMFKSCWFILSSSLVRSKYLSFLNYFLCGSPVRHGPLYGMLSIFRRGIHFVS